MKLQKIKLILSLCILLCVFYSSQSQSIEFIEFDNSDIQKPKLLFYEFDDYGLQVSNLNKNELNITENAATRKIVDLKNSGNTNPVSFVIGFNTSPTMTDQINPAKGFANRILVDIKKSPVKNSLGAVQSSGKFSTLLQNYTTDSSLLRNSYKNLLLSDRYDFDELLMNPQFGLLPLANKGTNSKNAILLTDGFGERLDSNDIEKYVAYCRTNKIRLFCVLLGKISEYPFGVKNDFKQIALRSGGKFYEDLKDTSDYTRINATLIPRLNAGSPTEITWNTSSMCSSDSVIVELKNIYSNKNLFFGYRNSSEKVISLSFSPSSVIFLDTPTGLKKDTVITVIAKNYDFDVTKVTLTNPAFDINPKSFKLNKNQSIDLTLSYTAPDDQYNFTYIDFETNICPQVYSAGGKLDDEKDSILKIEFPIADENFIAGTDTLIKWSGVSVKDTVKLEYSTNNGLTWNEIVYKTTGTEYLWKVPKINTTNLKIRISLLKDGSTKEWVRTFGGKTIDFVNSIALDNEGNIYSAGFFNEEVSSFGGVNLVSAGAEDIILTKHSSSGDLIWVKSMGGTGKDIARSLTIDKLNNELVVTGYFSQSTDFGSTTLNSSGSEDIFIAKFDLDGNLKWAKNAGGAGSDESFTVGIDSERNIVIGGYFTGNATFGNITISSVATSTDSFLAKYDKDGNIIWAKNVIRSGTHNQINGLVIDQNENIIVTGYFSFSAFIPDVQIISNSNSIDAFTIKYDKFGNYIWHQIAGGSYTDKSYSITIDDFDNIVVTGSYTTTAVFNEASVTSAGFDDIFVVKYRNDDTGKLVWVKSFGGIYQDEGNAVVTDKNGNIYVSGKFEETATFGKIAGNDKIVTSRGDQDAFIVKMNLTGDVEWVKRGGSTNNEHAYALTLLREDVLYFGGYFNFTLADFGDTLLINPDQNVVSEDAFIWRISDIVLQQVESGINSISILSATSIDIDFGDVIIGNIKDTIVENYITNTGNAPVKILGIKIIGNDAANFKQVDGFPVYEIPIGGYNIGGFRFTPSKIGIHKAQVMIMIQGDTLVYNLTGMGIDRDLVQLNNLIDFGVVALGMNKDTVELVISNKSSKIYNINLELVGANAEHYEILNASKIVQLDPSEDLTIELRFKPTIQGEINSTLQLNFDNPIAPFNITLLGIGIVGGNINVVSDSGRAGERKKINIKLDGFENGGSENFSLKYRAKVKFNSTMLAPINRNQLIDVIDGNSIIEVAGDFNNSDIITSLDLRVGLGNNLVTDIEIIEFVWMDDNGNVLDINMPINNGTFTLIDPCEEGGLRLINPLGKVQLKSVMQNNINNQIEINLELLEKGYTKITLQDINGSLVKTILEGENLNETKNIFFNTDDIASGVYFIVLETPTLLESQKILILK